MPDTPDLSLPAKAPSMARYHHEPMKLRPAALYSLADLSDAELSDLARECEAEYAVTSSDEGSAVRLAPQPRFIGQPLRAVFDHHLQYLEQNDDFEPKYFIAAVEKDWKSRGVLLVALDDDDLECVVDSFRIKASQTGLIIANLQIGNASWSEEKECYELSNSRDEGDGEDEGDGDGDDDGADWDDDDGPPAPTKNVPLGYYIPIYIHSNLSGDEVVAKLEPSFKLKAPEDLACRIQAKLTPATSDSAPTQDLIRQAASLHPLRCAKNKYLHKGHFLVVDTDEPVEDGMVMVNLSAWDAAAAPTRKDRAGLLRVGHELARGDLPYIRIPYSCHDGLQRRFLLLSNGDAEWPSDEVRSQPVYLVFQYNTHGKSRGYGWSLMDPKASKQKPGEERLIYPPELTKWEGGFQRLAYSFDEAVRCFPYFCRQERFVEGLDKEFFICVDGDDVAKTGVLLVQRKWDGDVSKTRSKDDLLGLPAENVKSARAPIKEALSILYRGKKGEIEGMSKELKDLFQ
jgi:hypothetical protein